MVRRVRRSVLNGFFERGERQLIRVLILASVLLVIVQLSLVKDPVQFYLAVAQKVESPSLDITDASPEKQDVPAGPATASQAETWLLTLKTAPAAAVRVWQEGKVIAVLGAEEKQVKVRAGVLQLDARNIDGAVRVQVIKRDSRLHEPRLNQTLVLNKDIQSMMVSP